LADDLRSGRVESVEGSVSKKSGTDWTYLLGMGQNPTTDYWLSVDAGELEKQEFRVSTAMYESVSAGSTVRLYYLPRSRRVVNLERLSDPRDPEPWIGVDAPSSGERNEPGTVDEAIVGTWSNPFLTVIFRDDRTLTARLPERPEEHSQWSVDADGHLCAELMGAPQVADVSIEGDTLTLSIGGRGVKLLRSATDD
jgi:hypothetical protein